MALTYVNLTLDLQDAQGNTPAQGTATGVLNLELFDNVDHADVILTPVTATWSGGSQPIVKMLANDSANLVPQGSVWTFTFTNFVGATQPATRSFSLASAGGSNQFLSDQILLQNVPQMSSFLAGRYPGNSSQFLNGSGQFTAPPVSSVNGNTGAVELTAANVGALAGTFPGNPSQFLNGNGAFTTPPGQVSSVNGDTGAVVLQPSDIGAAAADAVVTTVQGEVGDVVLAAADVGAVATGAQSYLLTVNTTGQSGQALVNSTPTITSFQFPSDGNAHRVVVTLQRSVTATETGGAVNVVGTSPDGNAINAQLQPGGKAVGVYNAEANYWVQSGSTISVTQQAALTAGTSKVWVDIHELHRQAVLPVNNAPTLAFGCDAGHFAAYQTSIPQSTSARVYVSQNEGSSGIPSAWPPTDSASSAIPGGATQLVISFRPQDLTGYLAGNHDAALKTWLAKIPHGSLICMYHEGNFSSNYFRSTLSGTATQFVAANQHLKALCVSAAPTLLVGQILLSAPTVQQSSPWVATGLDWYGIDGYGGASVKTAAETFGATIQTILNVVPNATMAITETNDAQATNAQWDQFFTDGFNLALQYNMISYLTWWGASGTSSPPTFSGTGPYVATLQGLAAEL